MEHGHSPVLNDRFVRIKKSISFLYSSNKSESVSLERFLCMKLTARQNLATEVFSEGRHSELGNRTTCHKSRSWMRVMRNGNGMNLHLEKPEVSLKLLSLPLRPIMEIVPYNQNRWAFWKIQRKVYSNPVPSYSSQLKPFDFRRSFWFCVTTSAVFQK